ncbi:MULTISPECIES: AAA family ATPase [Niastella]|uniref:AAA family ATPase n=1 Tax=Niastella soli TaxID=2821487 RepID=A0ABS3YUE7_9BACT|nr:AAA family ATPase [Niastella soli]MBO9201147.1 AAA family ATPase [Niastella soli]
MEKLRIRNFGPIEDADIDLKRINVFIGPQASGKSTIAKVISAFRSYNNLKAEWVERGFIERLKEDYGLSSFFQEGTNISLETNNGTFSIGNASSPSMLQEPEAAYYSIPSSVYIPTERVLVPLISENSFLFISEKIFIQKYITEFGILFQNGRKLTKELTVDFLDGVTYYYEDGVDKVKLKNGRTIRLTESSNGIQTTLPLLLAVIFLSDKVGKKNTRDISIAIEEPELSLFPSAQTALLKYLLELITPLNYHLTITTHSPYTLTTINNLIYAYQVGQMNKSVHDIVPDKLWLNPNDVGAWFVENGIVRSIIDEENNQIKAEEIDKISEVLNHEYDKIMDLKFS